MARIKVKKLRRKKLHAAPGASPGTLNVSAAALRPTIHVTWYNAERIEEREIKKPHELQSFLDRPNGVAWIDVHGLGDETLLRELGEFFHIHPLALEDVVHVPQRPKIEEFERHQFIIARMLMLKSPSDMEAEQVSIFLGRNYVLTFQETAADGFQAVRARLQREGGIHRRSGADYLCYSILDATIDNYFPVLESYGEYLEHLEAETVEKPTPHTLTQIHVAKRELLDLRRVLFPQRDMINQLVRSDTPLLSADVRIFLRDCYDHAVQVMEMTENYREIMSGLHDVYLSSIANRTNAIMKVLTIISTIFIPLTFIAGVYGMNFKTDVSDWNMPELSAKYGYPATMLAMLVIGLSLVFYFWYKGWIFAGSGEAASADMQSPHNATAAKVDKQPPIAAAAKAEPARPGANRIEPSP